MFDRMLRCALFKEDAFEEVEADRSATVQALLVVMLVAISTGIGSLTAGGVSGLLSGTVSAVIAWGVWAFFTYIVGVKLLPTPETHADWGQLARTTGFAQTPGILAFIGIVPGATIFGLFVIGIWQIACMVVGVRHALDYKSTGRAIAVVLIAFIPSAIVTYIINLILNPGAFTAAT